MKRAASRELADRPDGAPGGTRGAGVVTVTGVDSGPTPVALAAATLSTNVPVGACTENDVVLPIGSVARTCPPGLVRARSSNAVAGLPDEGRSQVSAIVWPLTVACRFVGAPGAADVPHYLREHLLAALKTMTLAS